MRYARALFHSQNFRDGACIFRVHNLNLQRLRFGLLAYVSDKLGNLNPSFTASVFFKLPLAIDAFRWAYTTRPNDPEVLTGLISAPCKKDTLTEQEFGEVDFCLRELNRVDPELGKSWEDSVVQFLKQRTGR